MSSSTLWHPVPGRLQSVSVADKDNIWGVTLDLQLCKFNSTAQQWRLVAVTSETVNRSRFSASSAQSLTSTSLSSLASSTPSSASSLFATKKISSLLPSLGLTSGVSLAQQQQQKQHQDQQQQHHNGANLPQPMQRENSLPLSEAESESEADTTIQVSAASDGTVVRLDKTEKAWYLIAPHDHVDFEKDAIWVDLGHFWKVVSVASISQIWGLSDSGDIYYGTSDRFVELKSSVTSGAGYEKPKFTHISVGHDNLVLATDAHSGIVFRLKTHPAASHPPVWTALPGAGKTTTSGSGLHFLSCHLSCADYIVGVTFDGHVYRFSNSTWVSLGGGAKLDNVDVGADGYILGVDRDGDLVGCQLKSTIVIPRRISSRGVVLNRHKKDDSNTPSSPQAPNVPNIPTTPRLQAASKRPMASPRELFEMVTPEKEITSTHHSQKIVEEPSLESSDPRSSSPLLRGNSYLARYTLGRTESQLSKRSYASDLPSASSTLHQQRVGSPSPGPYDAPSSLNKPQSLRIQTKGVGVYGRNLSSAERSEGDSYFSSKLFTTPGSDGNMSPPTSAPIHSLASYGLRSSSPHSPHSPHLDLTWSNSAKGSSPDSPSTPRAASQEPQLGDMSTAGKSSGYFDYKQRMSGTGSTGGSPTPYSPAKQRILEKAMSRSRSFQSQRSQSSSIREDDVEPSSMHKTGDGERADIAENPDPALSDPLLPHPPSLSEVRNGDISAVVPATANERDMSAPHDKANNGSRYSHNGMAILSSSTTTSQQLKDADPLQFSGRTDWTGTLGDNGVWNDDIVNMDVKMTETLPDNGEVLSEELGPPSTTWEPYKSKWIPGPTDDQSNHSPYLSPPIQKTNRLSASQQFWQAQEEHPASSSSLSSQDQRKPFTLSNNGPLLNQNQNQGLGLGLAFPPRNQDPDTDLEYYLSTPALASTHRPSDSSEILMLQQQEYLKLTRLRNRQSLAFADLQDDSNPYNKGISDFGYNQGWNINEKSEFKLDYPTLQEQQQRSSKEEISGELQHQPYEVLPESIPEATSSGVQRNPSVIMGLFKKRIIAAPGKDEVDEVNDRPSYSSAHLQKYVNTLTVPQTIVVDNRRGVIQPISSSTTNGTIAAVQAVPVAVPSTAARNEHPTTASNVRASGSGVIHTSYEQLRSGIQGEDDQGRWIGGANVNDTDVQDYDPGLHKSKCCNIL
ncbi:hypothetical protein BGX28_008424 [Mortierella sp. GBA30]|nr:hypothetical protein BGX28_008424 [Mortierella sp. GBA30]